MKNLTVTLPDETYQHLRVAAAKQGKSMSRLVGELVERRIGRPISKAEAMRRFLDGPLMDLTDENGNAPHAIKSMIAERLFFVDTNVLIYARDPATENKHSVARLWLDLLTPGDRMLLNLQVLNELTRWMLKNQKNTIEVVQEAIEMLREFGETPLSPDDVDLAWDVRNQLGYQWFDCLLIASAANAGCSHFLSEDMGHGARYGGLTIINPFRVDPDAFLKAN